MDYKKVISSQKLRFAILRMLDWIPDKIMLSLQYKIKLNRSCNFANPKRWTEKLQLYKMHYRNPLLGTCVDKYEVRSYVKSKGLENILVDLYGYWLSSEEINFDLLPTSFVLKTTNGGGGEDVVLVRDKNTADLKKTSSFLRNKLLHKNVNAGREWAYTRISKPRIIAEELLINKENPDAGIEDFKILCFHGVPYYIIVDINRYVDHRRNFYTPDWKRVFVTTDHEQFEQHFSRPKNLEKMLSIASKLSEDFPFVRVDLYNINGEIYFGELTFYPWSGYIQFTPDSFDYELGGLMDCSKFLPKTK